MNNRIAKTGVLLFVITAVSKVAAFVVTIVFSHYFGTDLVTDAYYAAGTIPNLVNNSLTICALTLFVPVFTQCKAKDGFQKADEFTANILNAFIVFNIALFIAVSIASPVLARLVAPGFNEEGVKHTTSMICLLSMSFPFTVAVYTLNNLYNANQKYILPALMTLFNHLFVIVLNIIIAPKHGLYSYPFICTGAWVIQLVLLFARANGTLFKHRFYINIRDKYFKYMLVQSVPVMLTTAADQINLAADNIISSDLPGGSLSCLGYAHRIFNSINGLVTATLLTIYYPIISKQYAEKDSAGLNNSLRKYFDIMLLMTLPVSLLLIGNAQPIINLLFHHGAMKDEDISKITIIFILYVSGMIFLSLKEFVTRLFYIIGDTKIPTIINAACVSLNILLSLTLKQFLGIYGIALATTIATFLCSMIESIALVKRAGGVKAFRKRNVVNKKSMICTALSSIMAMIFMILIQRSLHSMHPIISIGVSCCSFVVVLFAMLLLLKNEFVTHLVLRK